jgi:hypothetical protein
MTLRTVILGGMAAASLLTGCGGSGGSAARDGASSNTDERSALLEVSRCMREHGYPSFPDPVADSRGAWGFPESSQIPRESPAACERVARQAKSRIHRSGGDRKQLSAGDIAKARSFARCMREHGVSDFPDPDARGGFRMPARLRPPNGASVLRVPERACRQYMPKKGILVAGRP